MNRIQSINHRTDTYEISKTSLLCFYGKKHIINSKYDELPLDYHIILFMSDFWLSIIISNSVNHVKKDISKELMPLV